MSLEKQTGDENFVWKHSVSLILGLIGLLILAASFYFVWMVAFGSEIERPATGRGFNVAVTFLAGCLAGLGVLSVALLKYINDAQKLELDMREGQRADAELERIRTQEAARALGWLAAPGEAKSSREQRAGAILALGGLKRYSVALEMTQDMLRSGALEGSTASWLAGAILREPDPDLQHLKAPAAALLAQHPEKMFGDRHAHLPQMLLSDDILKQSPQVRRSAARLMIDMFLLRPRSEWHPAQFEAVVEALLRLESAGEPELRRMCGVALLKFLGAFKPSEIIEWSDGHFVRKETVDTITKRMVRYKLDELVGTLPDGRSRNDLLKEWGEG